MIVFFDIDGVLADCKHRLHYQEEKDYDQFYSPEEMKKDKPIQSGIELYESLCENMLSEMIIVTGRPYRTLETTKKWLEKNGVVAPIIIMRKDGDYRSSENIKVQALKKFFESEYYKTGYPEGIECALFVDDDPKNIKAIEKEFPKIKGLIFGSDRL